MSHKIESAAAEREPLFVETLEHLERITARVEAYRQENPPALAEIQATLAPVVELARGLRAEYAAYQARFAHLLERVAALDLDALENFHGFGHISPLPATARRLQREIVAAMEDLDGVLAQADAFVRGERADVQLWDIRETVRRLEEALRELPSGLRFLMAHMGTFESSQPTPPGETIQSSVRHV
jgi:ABC-type transporter Mla subunit MlaD